MKKILFILIAISTLLSCEETEKQKQMRIERERIAFVKDSIAKREAFVKDSIRIQDSIKNVEILKSYKNLFRITNDEFSSNVWYHHINSPKYVDVNGIELYFCTVNDVAQNLRFRYQYKADEWLFIREMIFNIDGEIFNLYPNMKRDNDSYIWEWCDESIKVNNAGITQRFIEKLINAKQAKVKLNGTNYYKVKEITPKQIKAMKQTYDYYKALGGKI